MFVDNYSATSSEDYTTRGCKPYVPIGTKAYFGENIVKQNRPIILNSSGEVEFVDVDYDTGVFIGEEMFDLVSVFGTIYVKQKLSTVYQNTTTLVVSAHTGTSYTLSGDFIGSPIVGNLTGAEDLEIDVTLTAGYGTKNFDLILPNTYAVDNIYSTSVNYSSASVNSTVDEYFGVASEYTQYWKENSCDLSNMTVEYKNPGDDLTNLTGNTVYMLSAGSYTVTGTINMSDCSALIGQ